MSKTADETAPSRWRFPKTDCSDLFGKGDLLATLISQYPVSLQPSAPAPRRFWRKCGHDHSRDPERVMPKPLSDEVAARGA